MAEAFRFVCSSCQRDLVAWSDGNPYVIDPDGEKRHVYHPNQDAYRAVGNDMPHLCLACGDEFDVDSLAPVERCPVCDSTDVCRQTLLAGRRCPYCRNGGFIADESFFMIS